MNIDNVHLEELQDLIQRFLKLARGKVLRLARRWDVKKGAPVFTRRGKYTSRGWTEWTQGFQFGSQILLFDGLNDEKLWELGCTNTFRYMPYHVSHFGVHDHGFNIISTYGNIRRLIREGRAASSSDFLSVCELALRLSGSVQASRWTQLSEHEGYIYSFNGPHSLFSDTIRTCRSLVLAHQLGHYLLAENDQRISLLDRALIHASTTAKYNVYYGKGRDVYDVRGRVAHESLFNVVNGQYRCPSTQQGYSPFTTWTRGLAWIILGFSEQLEALQVLFEEELVPHGGLEEVKRWMLEAATATADYYLGQTPTDGIPYWDTGAPGLIHLGDWRRSEALPDNPFEPVDSSAAVIAAQGFMRLGRVLGVSTSGRKYFKAGLTLAKRLFSPPYLSTDETHEGLILHSVYHRPRGWDYVPKGKSVPFGESSMWGDYHAIELAVYLQRLLQKEVPYLAFYDFDGTVRT